MQKTTFKLPIVNEIRTDSSAHVLNFAPLYIRPNGTGGLERNIHYFALHSRHRHSVMANLTAGSSLSKVDGMEAVYMMPPARQLRFTSHVRVMNALSDIVREPLKASFLRKIEFDILHIRAPYVSPDIFFVLDHFLGKTFFKKIAAWRLCKKPIVVTFHLLPSHNLLWPKRFEIPHFPQTLKERTSWLGLEKLLCDKAEAVICVDNYMTHVLSNFCDNSKIHFIPSGIDTDLFKPMSKHEALEFLPAEIRKRLPLNEFLILFVGRLDYVKGVQFLSQFAQGLPKYAKLVVVGEGAVSSELLSNQRLIYLGEMANHLIPYLINVSDVVFNPIIINGISRVTLEAMSCGKPVIMFGNNHNRHPAEHLKNALLVSDLDAARDAIHDLYESSSLRDTLCVNARNTAEKCSVSRLVKEVDKIYDKVLLA